MPLEIKVDHERRLVEVQAIGEITPRELLDYLHRIVVEEAIPYQKLFDASRSTFNFTDEEVMEAAAWLSAYRAANRGAVALIARSDETVAMMRRYMNLAGDSPPARLFSSVARARRWLDTMAAPAAKPLND
ncbi:MAG: hypothetical protein ISP49_07635 [Reyranella sp.]|nr:hypothetical protein [Reyranella sp.]MBL6651447.1 hypothetical protein [Reyranella sp.]